MEKRNDINISGSGRVSGGTYGWVGISGAGRVEGDTLCTTLKASGAAKVTGSLTCEEELRVSGSFTCTGAIDTGKIHISGSAHCEGDCKTEQMISSGSTAVRADLQAQEIRSSGSLQVGGSLQVQQFKSSGSLQVGKDCTGETFTASGRVQIGEMLNADRVEITLCANGVSRVEQIGGSTISVTRPREPALLQKLLHRKWGTFTCDTIEGDDITLEYTHARVVRGQRVTLGEGCRIETVEYSESLQQHDSARVQNAVQV